VRLEKTFERENGKNWRLFMRIIRAKAQTLQGMAAQFEVMERSGYLVSSFHPGVNAAITKGMSNLRRLVAAQSAEA
jgi:hypothetical protein